MLQSKEIDISQKVCSCWNREIGDCTYKNRQYIGQNIGQKIVGLINQAKNIVCITSFLLANKSIEDTLEQAVQRGVRVYLLLASENTLEKDFENEDDFSQKCFDSHVSLLQKMSGKMFIRSASNNHAKFIVVDPYTPDSKGLISTGNFTDDGVGTIKPRNEELCYSLSQTESDMLADYFKHAFWNCAKHEMVDNKFIPAESLGIQVEVNKKKDADIVSSLDGNKSLHDACVSIVKKATKTLAVSAFGFQEDNDIVQEIIHQAKNGVKVTILTRIRPKNKKALTALYEAGATIYGFQYLHAKCIIADGKKAFITSANFEDLSFTHSFEVGCNVRNFEENNIEDMIFQWILDAGWKLKMDTPLQNYTGAIMDFNIGKYGDEKTVVSEGEIDLGEVVLPLENIDAFNPNEMINEQKDSESEIVLRKKISWDLKPRILAIGSEKLNQKKKNNSEDIYPSVYKEPSGSKVVVIDKIELLSAAKKLKASQKCEAIVYAR